MIGSILLTHILSAEPAGEHGNEAVEGAHHLGEKIDHLTSVGPWFLTHGYLISVSYTHLTLPTSDLV